ncbi:hypothetical protein Pelo_18185 [Pelomyxa schiedti]|nr:hypothetical protein Pelo_18185 [Pelomyxa schiedti]
MAHCLKEEFSTNEDKITRLARNVAMVMSGLTVVFCTKMEECEAISKELTLLGISEVTSVSRAVHREEFLKHINAIDGKAVLCTTRFRNIDFIVNAGYKAALIVHWNGSVDLQEQYSREQACANNGVIIMMVQKQSCPIALEQAATLDSTMRTATSDPVAALSSMDDPAIQCVTRFGGVSMSASLV